MEYTKKDFGVLTNQKTNNLAIYIRRGQVVVGSNGLIDSDDDINAAFMAKHHRDRFDNTTESTATQDRVTGSNPFSDFDDGFRGVTDSQGYPILVKEKDRPGKNGVPAISVSEKAFKHYQAEKYRIDGQLRELEFQKKVGSLIPTELMGAVIAQQSKAFSSSFRQALSRMIDLLTVKYKLTGVDTADMRKAVVDAVNKSVEDALAESKRQVKAIAKEFSEKRKLESEI